MTSKNQNTATAATETPATVADVAACLSEADQNFDISKNGTETVTIEMVQTAAAACVALKETKNGATDALTGGATKAARFALRYLIGGGDAGKLAKVSEKKGAGVFGESVWKAAGSLISKAKKLHEHLSAGNAVTIPATDNADAVTVTLAGLADGSQCLQKAYTAMNNAKKAAKNAVREAEESRRDTVAAYLASPERADKHANLDVDTFLQTVPLTDPQAFGEALAIGGKVLDVERAAQEAVLHAETLERYAAQLREAGYTVEAPKADETDNETAAA